MKTLHKIITWSNANSGFISLLGFLFGSGIIASLLFQYAGIRKKREEIKKIKNKHLRRLRYILLALRVIGGTAVRLLIIAVVMFLICLLALKNPDETEIRENGYNRVLLNSTQEMGARVLSPDDTMFHDVDMLAQELMHRDQLPWEAVSTPFVSGDPQEMLRELEIEILKNPIIGDMVLQGVARLEGFNIYGDGDNTWVCEFYNEMNHAYAKTGSGVGALRWLKQYTFADGAKAIYVTDEYRFFGEQLCKHLEQYDIVGLMPVKVGIQYQRNHTLSYERLRAVSTRCDEVMDALVIRKNAETTNAADVMAFAVSDKRLLLSEPEGRG